MRSVLHKTNFADYSTSYGTAIATQLLKNPDLAGCISSVILVDPISILLNQPDVAYNFVRIYVPTQSHFTGADDMS